MMITLRSGRTVKVAMPDLYQLSMMDGLDIPNQALTDVMDLVVYGGMIAFKGPENDDKRREENRRITRSRFELAALCCQEPRLILRGEATESDLTPRDFVPDDLEQFVAFFRSGGSPSVPATTDPRSGEGAHADTEGEAVGEDARGTTQP